LLALTN